MNFAVGNRLTPGLRDKMSNGLTMHVFKTNDSRHKEGIIYVRESLDKGQVNTKKVVCLHFHRYSKVSFRRYWNQMKKNVIRSLFWYNYHYHRAQILHGNTSVSIITLSIKTVTKSMGCHCPCCFCFINRLWVFNHIL